MVGYHSAVSIALLDKQKVAALKFGFLEQEMFHAALTSTFLAKKVIRRK